MITPAIGQENSVTRDKQQMKMISVKVRETYKGKHVAFEKIECGWMNLNLSPELVTYPFRKFNIPGLCFLIY